MRELIYKNLTSVNSRKKDILLREVFEKDGVKARTERRCLYMIRDIVHMDTQEELKKWINDHGEIGVVEKRHFHILKKHSDKTGDDNIICKIIGKFYVVVDTSVYTIAFLHSFKVCFSKVVLT